MKNSIELIVTDNGDLTFFEEDGSEIQSLNSGSFEESWRDAGNMISDHFKSIQAEAEKEKAIIPAT